MVFRGVSIIKFLVVEEKKEEVKGKVIIIIFFLILSSFEIKKNSKYYMFVWKFKSIRLSSVCNFCEIVFFVNVLLKVIICEFIVFGVLFLVKEEGSVVLEDRL